MSIANRMVIEIVDGIINGVYSDCLDEFVIEVTDPEDIYDPEREKDRKRLAYLIEYGELNNLLEGLPEEENTSENQLPVFDTRAGLLIKEDSVAKTELGRALQKLDAVYLDGFLYGFSRLNRFIRELYREKNPSARSVNKILEPLRSYYNKTYDGLCDRLNSFDYDEVAKPDENEET